MSAASARSNSVKLLAMLWMVAAGGYVLYAWITFSGLYRWAAEWEVAQFGSYEVELTLLGFIVLVVLSGAALMSLAGPVPGWLLWGAAATPPPTAGRKQPVLLVVLLGLAAIPVSAGAGWLGYQKSQQPVTVEAVDLADHRPPQSTHVAMTGVAQTGLIVQYEETVNGSKTVTTYLPLTAPDWAEGQPITYFLKTNITMYMGPQGRFAVDSNAPPFPMTQQGVLLPNDLPGLVAAEYEKHGFTLASPAYVLDPNESADLDIYWELAAIAGIVALVCLLSAALMPIAARNAARRQQRQRRS
jgi:hypothetical protein